MNNIVLIGFMGCGKTSVGIRLSYRLKQTFLDTDNIIEKEQGIAIAEIFATKGEDAFREMETQCIEKLLEDPIKHIISVGGGLPVREENRKLLSSLGKVIYLQASPDTIYERVKHDTKRPLLQGDNPKKKIAELLEKRENIYESVAYATVCVDGKSFYEIMDEIEELVKDRRGDRSEHENTSN